MMNLFFSGDYHFSSLGMTSSQRPDVVPGNAIDAAANRFQKPMPSSMKYSEFDDENSGISTLNQGIENFWFDTDINQ